MKRKYIILREIKERRLNLSIYTKCLLMTDSAINLESIFP